MIRKRSPSYKAKHILWRRTELTYVRRSVRSSHRDQIDIILSLCCFAACGLLRVVRVCDGPKGTLHTPGQRCCANPCKIHWESCSHCVTVCFRLGQTTHKVHPRKECTWTEWCDWSAFVLIWSNDLDRGDKQKSTLTRILILADPHCRFHSEIRSFWYLSSFCRWVFAGLTVHVLPARLFLVNLAVHKPNYFCLVTRGESWRSLRKISSNLGREKGDYHSAIVPDHAGVCAKL